MSGAFCPGDVAVADIVKYRKRRKHHERAWLRLYFFDGLAYHSEVTLKFTKIDQHAAELTRLLRRYTMTLYELGDGWRDVDALLPGQGLELACSVLEHWRNDQRDKIFVLIVAQRGRSLPSELWQYVYDEFIP
jgi:hypothetical protein